MTEKYLTDKEVNYKEFGENDANFPLRIRYRIRLTLGRFFNSNKYRLTEEEINRIKSQKYPRKYYYQQQVLQVFELVFGFCALFLGIWLFIIFNSQIASFTDFKYLNNFLALGVPIILFSSMASGGGLAVAIIWYLYSKLPDPLLRDYILRKNMAQNWYGSFRSYYTVGFKVGIIGTTLWVIVLIIWIIAKIFISS